MASYLTKDNNGNYVRVVTGETADQTKQYVVTPDDARYTNIAKEYADANPDYVNERSYLTGQVQAGQNTGNTGLVSWAKNELAGLDVKAQNTASNLANDIGVNNYNYKSATYGDYIPQALQGNVNTTSGNVTRTAGGALSASGISGTTGSTNKTSGNSAAGGNISGNDTLAQLESESAYYLNMLNSAKASNDQALATAIRATLAQIESKRNDILEEQKNANTAAYVAYTQASNPYGINAERNAKIGLNNSGYSESNLVKLGNTYQGNINANELAKNQALQALELEKLQTQANSDIERAQAASDWDSQIASQGLNNAQTLYNARIQAQADTEAKAQQEFENAVYLWKMGFTSEEIGARLGLSSAQVASYLTAANAGTTSGTSSNKTSTEYTTSTPTSAANATSITNSLNSPANLEMKGYEAYKNAQTGGEYGLQDEFTKVYAQISAGNVTQGSAKANAILSNAAQNLRNAGYDEATIKEFLQLFGY